jgi:hypothetical protein
MDKVHKPIITQPLFMFEMTPRSSGPKATIPTSLFRPLRAGLNWEIF